MANVLQSKQALPTKQMRSGTVSDMKRHTPVPVVPLRPKNTSPTNLHTPIKVVTPRNTGIQREWADAIEKLGAKDLLIHAVTEAGKSARTKDHELYLFRVNTVGTITEYMPTPIDSPPSISFDWRTESIERIETLLANTNMMTKDETSCILLTSCIKILVNTDIPDRSHEAMSNYILVLHRVVCSLDELMRALNAKSTLAKSLKGLKCFIDDRLLAAFAESGIKPDLGGYLWYQSQPSATTRWTGSLEEPKWLLKHVPAGHTPYFKICKDTPNLNYKVMPGDDYRAKVLVDELEKSTESVAIWRHIVQKHQTMHWKRQKFLDFSDILLTLLNNKDDFMLGAVLAFIQAFKVEDEASNICQIGYEIIDSVMRPGEAGVEPADFSLPPSISTIKRTKRAGDIGKAEADRRLNAAIAWYHEYKLSLNACAYFRHAEDMASLLLIEYMHIPLFGYVNKLHQSDEPEKDLLRHWKEMVQEFELKIYEDYHGKLYAPNRVQAATSREHIVHMCGLIENSFMAFATDTKRNASGRFHSTSERQQVQAITILLSQLQDIANTSDGEKEASVSHTSLDKIDPCQGMDPLAFIFKTNHDNTIRNASRILKNHPNAELYHNAADLTSVGALDTLYNYYIETRGILGELLAITGADATGSSSTPASSAIQVSSSAQSGVAESSNPDDDAVVDSPIDAHQQAPSGDDEEKDNDTVMTDSEEENSKDEDEDEDRPNDSNSEPPPGENQEGGNNDDDEEDDSDVDNDEKGKLTAQRIEGLSPTTRRCRQLLLRTMKIVVPATQAAIDAAKEHLIKCSSKYTDSMVLVYLSSALWARLTVLEGHKDELLHNSDGNEDGPDPILKALVDQFLANTTAMWDCLRLDKDGRAIPGQDATIDLSDIARIDPLARGMRLCNAPMQDRSSFMIKPEDERELLQQEVEDNINFSCHHPTTGEDQQANTLTKLKDIFKLGDPVQACLGLSKFASFLAKEENEAYFYNPRTYAYRYNMVDLIASWFEYDSVLEDMFSEEEDFDRLRETFQSFEDFCRADANTNCNQKGEEQVLACRAMAVSVACRAGRRLVSQWELDLM